MNRDASSIPLSAAFAIASLAVGSNHCGSSSATSGSDDAPNASGGVAPDSAAASDGRVTSCATECPRGALCCSGEDGADGNGGLPEEGSSPEDGADGDTDGSPEEDATSSPEDQPGNPSQLDASDSSDASREADGDAGTCTSNSDCAEDQWCVEFVQTRGLINITHTQCMTTTCSSVDCGCAQSMCGSYYCSVANGQLVCRDNDV